MPIQRQPNLRSIPPGYVLGRKSNGSTASGDASLIPISDFGQIFGGGGSGSVNFSDAGIWNSTTAYTKGQIVRYKDGWYLCNAALPTSPNLAIDGGVVTDGFGGGGHTFTNLLTTSNAGTVFVVFTVFSSFGLYTVNSVSSPHTTGWTRYKRYTSGLADNVFVEIWTASAAAALTNEAFTWSTSDSSTVVHAAAFCVNAGAGFVAAFDTNGSNPGESQGATSIAHTTFNTSSSQDMLLYIECSKDGSTNTQYPTGFTGFHASQFSTAWIVLASKNVVTPESGFVVNSGNGSLVSWIAAGIGLVGATSGSATPDVDTAHWVQIAAVDSYALDQRFGNNPGDILYRDSAAWQVLTPGAAGNVLTLATSGLNVLPQWAASSGGSVSITGGAGITVTPSPLTGTGTVALTVPISPANGGTGVANNASSTITITGNFGTTFTVTAATNITLPSGSHTMATLDQSQTFTGTPQIWNTGANTTIKHGQYAPNTTFNFLTLNGDLSASGIGLIGGDSTQLGHLFLHIPTSGGQIIDHIGSSNVVTTTSTEVTYAYGASVNLQIGKWAGGTYNMVSFNASFSATAGIGFIGGGGGDSNVYAVAPTGGTLTVRINNVNAATLGSGGLGLNGTTSGTLTIKPPATASGTLTLPAGTTDFSATGGTSQVVKQMSAGGAFTVGTLADTDLSGAAWTAYTPTCISTAGTLTTVSTSGRYKQVGKTVFFVASAAITTNGTGSGAIRLSTPVTSGTGVSGFYFALGREITSTGKQVNGAIYASNTLVDCNYYDNTYPGGNGTTIIITGTYEAA